MDLPNKMAEMGIMEIDEPEDKDQEPIPNESTSSSSSSRVLRTRKPTVPEVKSNNRRVCMKPKKRIINENAFSKGIEKIYLNQRIKFTPHSLETIYEEANTDSRIGGRKMKRLLICQPGNKYTKEKIKMRRAKIKKLLGNKSFLNRKKIPLNTFLESIKDSESDDEVYTEVASVEHQV